MYQYFYSLHALHLIIEHCVCVEPRPSSNIPLFSRHWRNVTKHWKNVTERWNNVTKRWRNVTERWNNVTEHWISVSEH